MPNSLDAGIEENFRRCKVNKHLFKSLHNTRKTSIINKSLTDINSFFFTKLLFVVHNLDLSLISLANLSIKSESTKFLREKPGKFLVFCSFIRIFASVQKKAIESTISIIVKQC